MSGNGLTTDDLMDRVDRYFGNTEYRDPTGLIGEVISARVRDVDGYDPDDESIYWHLVDMLVTAEVGTKVVNGRQVTLGRSALGRKVMFEFSRLADVVDVSGDGIDDLPDDIGREILRGLDITLGSDELRLP